MSDIVQRLRASLGAGLLANAAPRRSGETSILRFQQALVLSSRAEPRP